MRNKGHTHHIARELFHFVERLRHLYAATLAAPPGVNLRFNDPYFSTELFSGCHGFINAKAGYSLRCGNPKPAQDFFGLIFVDFHIEAAMPTTKYIVITLPASGDARQMHL